MTEQRQSLTHPFVRLLYWAVLGFVAWHVTQAYLTGMLWDHPVDVLSTYIAGTAIRPFVYRVLVPMVVDLALRLYPLSNLTYATIVIYGSLLGFLASIRSLAAIYGAKTQAQDIVGVAALVLMLPWLLLYRHHYDLTQIFLFTLGLRLMASRRWRLFLPVFALGCLNKETTILLTTVFAWHYRHELLRLSRSHWLLVAAQGAIFGAIRLLVMWRFAQNAGQVMEYHLPDQIDAWRIAFWPSLALVLFGALLLFQVSRTWNTSPHLFRSALLGTLPILLVLFIVWGYPFELRNLFEAYPALVLLALPTLVRPIRLDLAMTDTAPYPAVSV